jgi:hypothetical protein
VIPVVPKKKGRAKAKKATKGPMKGKAKGMMPKNMKAKMAKMEGY